VHFASFPTKAVLGPCLALVKHVLGRVPSAVQATGGGAFNFARKFAQAGVRLDQCDEMRAMTRGLDCVLASGDDAAVFVLDPGDPLAPCSPAQANAIPRQPLPSQGAAYPYLFASLG